MKYLKLFENYNQKEIDDLLRSHGSSVTSLRRKVLSILMSSEKSTILV